MLVPFMLSIFWLTSTFKGAHGSDIYMSCVDGNDIANCGTYDAPCKSLKHTFNIIAKSGDSILLYGGNTTPCIYNISNTITFTKDININSYEGHHIAVINSVGPGYIFDFQINSKIQVSIESLEFTNSKILSFQATSYGIVTFINCIIKNCTAVSSSKRAYITITMIGCHVYGGDGIRISEFVKLDFRVHTSSFSGNNTSIIIGPTIQAERYIMEITQSKLDINYFIANARSPNSRIYLTDCRVQTSARYLVEYSNKLSIKNTIFTGSNGMVSGVSDTYIENVTVMDTGKPLHCGIIISACSNVRMISTTFLRNNNGALCLRNSKHVELSELSFVNNTSTDNGGAISIDNCSVIIRNCFFNRNSATIFGGSIFNDGELAITNASFVGSYEANLPLGGSVIYSLKKLSFNNVSVKSIRSESSIAVVFHTGSAGSMNLKSYMFQCPINFKVHLVFNDNNSTTRSTYLWYCIPCEKGTYSLNFGEKYNGKVKKINCHSCPRGGDCSGYGLRNRYNYWGYINQEKATVTFVMCPPFYCSRSNKSLHEKPYGICAGSRTGRLCGVCTKGYSEDLLSTQCVENRNCSINKQVLFWFVSVFVALLYTIFLLYPKEIIIFFKRRFCDNSGEKGSGSSCHYETLDQKFRGATVDSSSSASNNDDTALRSTYVSFPDSNPDYVAIEKNVFGCIHVLLFYYQAAILLSVNSSAKQRYASPSMRLTDIISSIFNIKLVSEYKGFSVCPVLGLDVISKEIMKIACIFVIIFVIVLLGIVNHIYTCYNRPKGNIRCAIVDESHSKDYGSHFNDHSQNTLEELHHSADVPFTIRLRRCFISVLMFSYLPMSAFLLKFLNCVKISGENVLYIQGEVQCYKWWQNIICVFAAFWIIPLCPALYLASNLLETFEITTNQFIKSLVFPPYIFYYYLRYKLIGPITKPTITSDEKKINTEILLVLCQPFRLITNDTRYVMWHCVDILRKLLLVIAYTFINHPIGRLYVLIFLLIIFILYHGRIQPFRNVILNRVEILSLVMLIFIGVLNMYWAIGYTSEFTLETDFSSTGNTVFLCEVLLLLLPVLVMIIYLLIVISKKLIKCFKFYISKQE